MPSLTTLDAGVSLLPSCAFDPPTDDPAALETILGDVCRLTLGLIGGESDRFASPAGGDDRPPKVLFEAAEEGRGDVALFAPLEDEDPDAAAAAAAAADPLSRNKYSIHRFEKDSLAAKSMDSPPAGRLWLVLVSGSERSA